jgi:hypothetical protein
VRPNEILQAFKTACTLIELWPPGLLRKDRRCISCYPYPAGFFPPLLREGVAAERNATQLSDVGAGGSRHLEGPHFTKAKYRRSWKPKKTPWVPQHRSH